MRSTPAATGFKDSHNNDKRVSLSPTSVAAVVTDLASPTTADLHARVDKQLTVATRNSETVTAFVDPIKAKLLEAYETLNSQIVANEKVLEDCAGELEATPVVDLDETSRLVDENEEMRRLIVGEIEHRNAALALLTVYVWRQKTEELSGMLRSATATNVLHIQRAYHHYCAQLSTQIQEKQMLVDQIKTQLDATTEREAKNELTAASKEPNRRRGSGIMIEKLATLLVRTDKETKRLKTWQRREFIKLIHYDERLRVLIQELLRRV